MKTSKTLSRTARSVAIKSGLEKNIRAKKERITELQHKIEQWELDQQASDNFMNQYPEADRVKLRERLTRYRKSIGKSGDTSATLVEQTKAFFRQKRDEMRELDAKIADAKQRLANSQSHLKRTKLILMRLRLPDLESSMLDLRYKDCIDINSRLLNFLRRMEFHKDDIAKSQQETKDLQKEIKTLTPPPVTLKRAPQRKTAVSVKSSPEMLGAENYESARMKRAMNSCKGVFQKAKGSGAKLSVVIKAIERSLNQADAKIRKTQKEARGTLPKQAGRQLKLKDMREMFAKERKTLGDLIRATKEKQEELDIVLTDIPEIRTKSPEGLLKWREHLLHHQEDMREKFEKEIARSRAQLQDAKVIKRTRVDSLAKKHGRPDLQTILKTNT